MKIVLIRVQDSVSETNLTKQQKKADNNLIIKILWNTVLHSILYSTTLSKVEASNEMSWNFSNEGIIFQKKD